MGHFSGGLLAENLLLVEDSCVERAIDQNGETRKKIVNLVRCFDVRLTLDKYVPYVKV